jgi:hypothetical protein
VRIHSTSFTLLLDDESYGATETETINVHSTSTACLEAVPLFSDTVLTLRRLTYQGFHMLWSSSIYASLFEIDIAWIPSVESWSGFLHALERSPRLEKLRVWFKTFSTRNRFPVADMDLLPSFSLPHLIHFFGQTTRSTGVKLEITVLVYPWLPPHRRKRLYFG